MRKYYYILAAMTFCFFLNSCSERNNEEKVVNDEKISANDEDIAIDDEISTINDEAVESQENTPADTQNAPADWMPENAKVTETGLGVVITNPGDPSTKADYATQRLVHYRGRLLDGTTFDSSYDRGAPVPFAPSQVVPGFGEGLMMLGKGGKATLYIPSYLAYGPQGVPQAGIGPNENLIFDVEIIDIAK